MPKLLALIAVFCIFISKTSFVLASDLVINEFYPGKGTQWIEIYNSSDRDIDITGWILDDDGGSQKYVVSEQKLIGAKEFSIFESGLFNLNTSTPDTVRLINGEEIVDSYYYEPNSNGLTYGRLPDGSSNWVILQSQSPGTSNNSAIVITNTPIPAPSPTKTPKPSATPKPQKNNSTSTSSDISPTSVTYSNTANYAVNTASNNTNTKNTKSDLNKVSSLSANYPTAILGDKTRNIEIATKSAEKNVKHNNSFFIFISGLFIILSVVLYFYKDTIKGYIKFK